MTATPIPRTLALTLYGDLDVSILDELPQGRGSVVTELVLPTDRSRIYERIRASLQQGRQAYIICPRIDEGVNEMKNVVAEAARLKKEIFPEYRIGILHGKLTKEKKEAAMSAFAGHEIDILVATSVVEVGINVPNATTIIIEGAERFGLAQLHQLRGRVQRSTYEAHCYLFADTKSEKTLERMKLFVSAKNGFELAEYDLHLRGAGELSGASQWGVSDIGMEALRNPKLVVAARESARALVESDPTLSHNASLALRVKDYRALHLE